MERVQGVALKVVLRHAAGDTEEVQAGAEHWVEHGAKSGSAMAKPGCAPSARGCTRQPGKSMMATAILPGAAFSRPVLAMSSSAALPA